VNHAVPIARLARVFEALAAERLPAPEDRKWAVSSLRSYFDGDCGFIEAFGLEVQPGQSDPRTVAALERRNELICEASLKHWPVAADFHRALSRYATAVWPRERLLPSCPQSRLGKPEEFLWRILRERDHVISSQQIRDITHRSAPLFTAIG
jgi:hypothetical protein